MERVLPLPIRLWLAGGLAAPVATPLSATAHPPPTARPAPHAYHFTHTHTTAPNTNQFTLQAVMLHDLLHQMRFPPPDGTHLSPAGALLFSFSFVVSGFVFNIHLSPTGARLFVWNRGHKCLQELSHILCTRAAGMHRVASILCRPQPAFLLHLRKPPSQYNLRLDTLNPAPTNRTPSCTAWYRLPGEYNLRLGIMKELRPEMVATHQVGALPLSLV